MTIQAVGDIVSSKNDIQVECWEDYPDFRMTHGHIYNLEGG